MWSVGSKAEGCAWPLPEPVKDGDMGVNNSTWRRGTSPPPPSPEPRFDQLCLRLVCCDGDADCHVPCMYLEQVLISPASLWSSSP